jgi:hypothetical protein
MGMSKELRLFLDEEAGRGISDQITHIDNMLAEMYQMNPARVRKFDPLNFGPREHHSEPRRQGPKRRAPRLT